MLEMFLKTLDILGDMSPIMTPPSAKKSRIFLRKKFKKYSVWSDFFFLNNILCQSLRDVSPKK